MRSNQNTATLLCLYFSLLYLLNTLHVLGFVPSSQCRGRRSSYVNVQHLSSQETQLLFDEEDDSNTKWKSSSVSYSHESTSRSTKKPSDFIISKDPVINQLYEMRNSVQSCPELWFHLAKIYPQGQALQDIHQCDEPIDLTFADMKTYILASASVFQTLGICKGENVAIFGENSAYWLLCDHGIQYAGGASAVRGADASPDELRYIYNHSDSAGIVVLQGPKLLQRFIQDSKKKGISSQSPLGLDNEKYGPVRHVILMHKENKSTEDIQALIQSIDISVVKVQVHLYKDLLSNAIEQRLYENFESVLLRHDDLSTIVYTSGTTGTPKGVMLTHGNLLHQIGHRLSPHTNYDESEPLPGELMLALLPVWHITERTFELWLISRGCCITYSGIRTFKEDLAKYKPQWLVLVPRVLEKIAMGIQDKFSSGSKLVKVLVKLFSAVGGLRASYFKISNNLVVGDHPPHYLQIARSKFLCAALSPLHTIGTKIIWSKVQNGFGGRVKVIICGGSALASSLESFYEISGIPICVGYGLTECSPLLTHRQKDRNLVAGGSVGHPCIDTEIRIVDPDDDSISVGRERLPLPLGQVGLIIAKGPQVTRGYYNNVQATEKAIDKFGFFDTGDLGSINPATGDLIITGRCKDTIVLSNGENIEPSPIEDVILAQIPLIQQIMLTGQDGRSLIAIVVLNINGLVEAGFLNAKMGKTLQSNFDKVNDPKCSEDECLQGCTILNDASEALRKNPVLVSSLMEKFSKATVCFRKWEQVGSIFITLEPFSICNSLLTQSYKVKRDAVLRRYEGDIKKIN